jgi:RND superfamily putative drug exporter
MTSNVPSPTPTVRWRWPIVIVALVLAALAGIFGGSVQDRLKSGGFEDPDAESSQVRAILEDEFGTVDADVVLLLTPDGGNVDTPEARAAAEAVLAEVAAEPTVDEVTSYYALGSPPPLRSTDGEHALALVRLKGTEDERLNAAGELVHAYDGQHGAVDVGVGGVFATFAQVNEVIEEDLVTAEIVAFPLTLILLVVIFGSIAAALLPMVIGGLAIVGTFAVLTVIASVTDVSIFALNFTTAMGLGLAIDYSLLVVSRFREELDAGYEVPEAVHRTVRTAGRTVLFSAGTVAASLIALLVFTQYFLRSFAYAGIAVVGLAAVGAVVVLPAILALVGRNVNRWTVRKPKPVTDEGRWHRLAMFVMRRPIPIATGAMVFLFLLGAPFFGVELGFPDERVLPVGQSTRDVGDVLRTEFGSAESRPTVVLADGIGDPATRLDEIGTYAARLSAVDGVARVDSLAGSYQNGFQLVPPSDFSQRFLAEDATYLSLAPAIEPISLEAEQMIADVRAAEAPFDVMVGGPSAELVDGKSDMLSRLPLALGVIAVITFVVLFMSFGSILMPIKAIVLNLLSLSATFGALVWVFQEGHMSGLLGFTATGTLVITMPVLMFITAFGLSMDYEVFMLSRVKEEYDRTGDDIASVAVGLERTGRIVTAAAVLIAVVFAAFSTGSVSFMKMFGIGMTLAVLVDAFVVRTTLVPAFMRLAGRANWWAPRPLRRFHDRFGFAEHAEAGQRPAVVQAPAVEV